MPKLDSNRIYKAANAHAEKIAVALLGEPTFSRSASELRWGAHGSLLVTLSGEFAGRFHNFETKDDGDMIDLIKAHHGVDHQEACSWAATYLGREELTISQAPIAVAGESVSKEEYAAKLWKKSVNLVGSAGAVYLQKRLCNVLTDEQMGALGLRWLRGPGGVAGAVGCITAEMVDPISASFSGIHRTFVSKEHRRISRKLLGPAGFVRLIQGEATDGTVLVAEGIETALSAAVILSASEVWASGSASMLAEFPVLSHAKRVMIAADHDSLGKKGRPGEKAAMVTAERYRAAGIDVTIVTPKQEGTDFNDLLRECAKQLEAE